MEILGYKCFNSDLTNNYGVKFEVGKKYTTSGQIKFGTMGNGFHMCKRLEDTLRYFDAIKKEVSICEVKGSGTVVESFDEYYGYYNIYSVEELEIIRELTREEIINMAIKFYQERAIRFISGFKLKEDEILLFKQYFKNNSRVISFIEYYQEGNLYAFKEKTKKLKK